MIMKTKKQISEESKENKQKSESELEKEIEETESQEANEETIDNNQFREFIRPFTEEAINIHPPVLERVEIPQQESLEQDVASVPITQTKDEEQIKYSSKYNEADYKITEEESRRINENLLVRSTPITTETTRINLHPQIEQNFQIAPELQELRKSQEKLEEDYIAKAEKLDTGDNRLPFESTQRKYKGKII